MAKKQALGRNFYSLLDDNMIEGSSAPKTTLKISRISPRSDQPRKNFDEDALLVGWVEFDLPCLEGLDGLFGERFDIDEPLFLEEWLDNGVALVAVSNRVNDALFPA